MLLAATAAGCTEDPAPTSSTGGGSGSTPAPSATSSAPSLEASWTIPGLNANPHSTGPHHWLTHQYTVSGVGKGSSISVGPLLLVDTRTGRSHAFRLRGGQAPCLMPTVISPSGVTPVLSASRVEQPYVAGGSYLTEPCTRAQVLDATSGKLLWRRALDLDGLGVERAVGATDEVVAVVDALGRRRCWTAREGDVVDRDDRACRSLADRLTHADLPDLVDADGQPVTIRFGADAYDHLRELGRTDDVLLVADLNGAGEPVVRAHDLATGETLWQDEPERDPHEGGPWVRTERWAVLGEGLLHVTYEHPRRALTTTSTPMVLTAADARTGKDLRRIGTVRGGLFAHQFGNVTVALTQQELQLSSTISGFELPDW